MAFPFRIFETSALAIRKPGMQKNMVKMKLQENEAKIHDLKAQVQEKEARIQTIKSFIQASEAQIYANRNQILEIQGRIKDVEAMIAELNIES